MVQTVFTITADAEPAKREIIFIGEEIKKTKAELQSLEREASSKMNKVLHMAQLGWGLMQGVIRAAGGSISMTTRLVVSAGFGAVRTLIPLFVAHGSLAAIRADPAAMMQVIVGLAEIGSAVASLIAYQTEQKKLSMQLRGLNFAFMNIGSMISAQLSWSK